MGAHAYSGPHICARKTYMVMVENSNRPYCRTHEREYDKELRARKKNAAVDDSIKLDDCPNTARRLAIHWQNGPNGEGLVIGPLDHVPPPPSGKAICQW